MPAHHSNPDTLPLLAEQLLHGPTATPPVSSSDGTLALIRHRFAASNGPMGHPSQLRVALALAGGGRLRQQPAQGPVLDAIWSAGQFNVVLPGQTGRYASPEVEILGLAMDCSTLDGAVLDCQTLAPMAARLHRDATISALLQALWAAADAGVLSDTLLQSAAAAVLHRLHQLAHRVSTQRNGTAPLSSAQLERLGSYLDACLDQRPSVTRMATLLGMESNRFGRAMQAATAMTPYQFLSHRRMHWAQQQLQRGHSVSRVAQWTGYANASKFAAAFRRVIGHAPSATGRQ